MPNVKPERILIIRLKSIGDVLQTLPAVNAVRTSRPDAHISYLVCRSNAELLSGFTAVNEVITIDRAALKTGSRAIPGLVSIIHRVCSRRFTHVIDLQGYGETAWLTWMSGAKQRWGSVYRCARRMAYTQGIRRRDDMHAIDWNLCLLRECGMPVGAPDNTFTLPAIYREKAELLFRQQRLDLGKPTLLIQPFTSRAEKNWPLEKYLAVADSFRRQGVQILFCGGPGDVVRLDPARMRGYPVIAGEPLLVTAGLISLSRLVLGGDTGILHLAIALGVRVLMLFNRRASEPGCSIPYGHPDWVVDPTGFGNLTAISVDRVLGACREALPEYPNDGSKVLFAGNQGCRYEISSWANTIIPCTKENLGPPSQPCRNAIKQPKSLSLVGGPPDFSPRSPQPSQIPPPG